MKKRGRPATGSPQKATKKKNIGDQSSDEEKLSKWAMLKKASAETHEHLLNPFAKMPLTKPTTQDALITICSDIKDIKKQGDNVRQEIRELKNDLATKMDQLEEHLKETNKKVDELEYTIMEELADRDRKQKELIIFKVEESKHESFNVKREMDTAAAMKKLREHADVREDDFKVVRRLGRYDPEKRDPRPLLIGFYGQQIKDQVMASCDRKKDRQIRPSLTHMQRNRLQMLYEQRDAKNGEEKDKNKLWIVSGPPGEATLRYITKTT